MARLARKSKTRIKPLAVTDGMLLRDERPWHDATHAEALREAWFERRDTLLPKWIAGHPATRPLAWWAFDSPEPRTLEESFPIYCGWMLANYRRDPTHGESCYEREIDYLARHGLITGDECTAFEMLKAAYDERQAELMTPERREWLAAKRAEYDCPDFGSGWRFTTRTGGLGWHG